MFEGVADKSSFTIFNGPVLSLIKNTLILIVSLLLLAFSEIFLIWEFFGRERIKSNSQKVLLLAFTFNNWKLTYRTEVSIQETNHNVSIVQPKIAKKPNELLENIKVAEGLHRKYLKGKNKETTINDPICTQKWKKYLMIKNQMFSKGMTKKFKFNAAAIKWSKGT